MHRNRVREARQQLGLSQDEMVRRTGLSRSTLEAIERGYRLPKADTMWAIARALGKPIEYLFPDPKGADGHAGNDDRRGDPADPHAEASAHRAAAG